MQILLCILIEIASIVGCAFIGTAKIINFYKKMYDNGYVFNNELKDKYLNEIKEEKMNGSRYLNIIKGILYLIPGVNIFTACIEANTIIKILSNKMNNINSLIPMTDEEIDTYLSNETTFDKINYATTLEKTLEEEKDNEDFVCYSKTIDITDDIAPSKTTKEKIINDYVENLANENKDGYNESFQYRKK